MIGSAGGIRLFFIRFLGGAPPALNRTQCRTIRQSKKVPSFTRAKSNRTTEAASRGDEQRGHFCPGLTMNLGLVETTLASTVWVQIGQ